jgi:LPXTG-motif cell wall-anchored protein
VLVALGITFQVRLLRLAGVGAIILAVLPQTYNYILSLPRWVVVGILGMLFLGLAIFLLLRRKEE